LQTSHKKLLAARKRLTKSRMTDHNYLRLANFRYRLRQFLEFSADAARAIGITPQQHQALLAIKGLMIAGQATVADVAKQLVSRHHSTVELIDRLSALGLIRRNIDAADNRRVNVALTAKAEKILARLSATHLHELKRLSPTLQAMVDLVNEPLVVEVEKLKRKS
jgi:DNA-binding MarR family transcriptional regulator